MKQMRTAAIGAALLNVSLVTPSVAEQDFVQLQTTDGQTAIEGNLVSYEQGVYLVETSFGPIKVQGEGMSCEGAACPVVTDAENLLRIVGSPSMTRELMPLLIAGFGASQNAVSEPIGDVNMSKRMFNLVSEGGFGDQMGQIAMNGTSASGSFTGLLDKSTQIGVSSRRITRDEAMALQQDGAGSMVNINRERVIAIDSLVVITNPESSVESLSMRQVADIYSGNITSWSQLGGPDETINVYARGQGSGARYEFDSGILGEPNATISARNLNLVKTDIEMAAGVFSDPYGIGYLSLAAIRGNKPIGLSNSCGITMTPTEFSAKTEEYPLSRRLYMYSRQDNLDAAAETVLDFAISQDADNLVTKAGFISLAVDRYDLDAARNRLRETIEVDDDGYVTQVATEMLNDMRGWDRLSTTFRFRSGSLSLDAKAQRDVARLVTYLQAQPGTSEVAVVGFTDDNGAFDGNLSLSRDRAESVSQDIQAIVGDQLSHVTFTSKGFGQMLPATCNDGAQGQAINRRVEIWVRSAT